MNCFTKSTTRRYSLGWSTTTSSVLALKKSRIVRGTRSRSWWINSGAEADSSRLRIRAPELRQKPHVALDVSLVAPLARGPDDEAFILPRQLLDDLLEPLSFLFVLDLAGDGHVARVGHEHQEPAGQGYMGGDAGALHSQRVLGNLDQDLLVRAELLFDPEAALLGSGFEQHLVVISVDGRRQPRGRFDVRGVEEGGFLQSDVHEGRLHPRQHPSDPSLVDVADAAFLLGCAR